ncbi:MAG: DUF4159 domain-containing protein [Bacteroidetes bacterium]|nr:DUF4159 domain-containing protein [Bacteroidota bacterium]
MKRVLITGLILWICCAFVVVDQPIKIALLKYNGGGDWYANPTSLPNLAKYCNQNIGTNIDTDIPSVEVGSAEIFNYPFVHMTGHGNVVFNEQELSNLRAYLVGGGFLHADDNYGMDKFIRPQLEKLFPGSKLIELPFSHAIFHQKYDFPNGLPKIHEHDGLPPQAFGIFHEGRLVVLYTYQCDLGDGWEDPEVHKDPEPVREKALKMGANIIRYVFSN